mmetsp:Transcript_110819/g.253909  ORF Transcript_110819/g.253909 Transcript_110819/m.253909 type:complete len:295 (+) Transcript_110819:354-1238(+)
MLTPRVRLPPGPAAFGGRPLALGPQLRRAIVGTAISTVRRPILRHPGLVPPRRILSSARIRRLAAPVLWPARPAVIRGGLGRWLVLASPPSVAALRGVAGLGSILRCLVARDLRCPQSRQLVRGLHDLELGKAPLVAGVVPLRVLQQLRYVALRDHLAHNLHIELELFGLGSDGIEQILPINLELTLQVADFRPPLLVLHPQLLENFALLHDLLLEALVPLLFHKDPLLRILLLLAEPGRFPPGLGPLLQRDIVLPLLALVFPASYKLSLQVLNHLLQVLCFGNLRVHLLLLAL